MIDSKGERDVIFERTELVSSRRAQRLAWIRPRGAFARVALAACVLVGASSGVGLLASFDGPRRADESGLVAPRAPGEVVVLRLERGDGSACHAFCAGASIAWTAAHCVDDDARPLRVRDAEGRVTEVDRVELPPRDRSSAGDVTHRAREDRAELHLQDPRVCVGSPRRATVRRGDPVELHLFRSPARSGRAGRAGSGVLATSPLVCAGDSGAPLLDGHGALVGLAVGRSGVGCDEGASFFVTTGP